MYQFCTYFERNYLLRGLPLYSSLVATGCDFTLNLLVLDKETEKILAQFESFNLKTIPLATLEAWEPELETARSNSSIIKYYFTLRPLLPLYVLKHAPQIQLITYLDADLYFYGSPEPMFTELAERSILVIEHRHPEHSRTTRDSACSTSSTGLSDMTPRGWPAWNWGNNPWTYSTTRCALAARP